MKKIFSFIAILLLGACSSSTELKPTSNTQLTVTYFEKEVHRRGGEYVSETELKNILRNGQEDFIIFSAPWCGACKLTKKAAKQADLKKKVYWVNLDEAWAKRLASLMGIEAIPLLVHIDEKGKTIGIRAGPGKILVYLLTRM
jgi:thioredoxin-related protein